MDAKIRESVRQRASRRCEYCHLPEAADEWPFHLEHIVAHQHGGEDSVDNLCWACSRCNLCKGTNLASRDPQSGRQVQLFHPRLQSWNEHFTVVDARIVGMTGAGRATVQLLKMNESRRVELRRESIESGIFET